MLGFFLSIKTSLWLTGLIMALFIAGSFLIPQNLDVFSEINEMPLFLWLSKNGSYMSRSFWIYLSVAIMALLCGNTAICSIDALIRRLTWKRLMEVLSPQVLHLGVMAVLMGHLISASTGYKQDVPMTLNEPTQIRGFTITVKDIESISKEGESSPRWMVRLGIDDEVYTIEPARPAFHKRVGFFVRAAEEKKMRVIMGLVYDPGALWEVIGAVVFVIGAGGIAYMKFSSKWPNTM